MIRPAFTSLCALIGLSCPSAAMAHRIDADCQATSNGYRIEFFTGDGSAAADLAVTAQLEGAEPNPIGRTDDKGIIEFVPPSPGKWTIVGTGAGHSTSAHPLVIVVDKVEAGAAGSLAAQSQPAAVTTTTAATARSKRGQFPWLETGVSLAFIAALTSVTLLMMRRSAYSTGRPAAFEELSHEVGHLRSEVRELREELAEIKAEREARS